MISLKRFGVFNDRRKSIDKISVLLLLLVIPIQPIRADFPQKFTEQWSFKKIKVQDAWNKIEENNEVIVAILDHGVDYHHSDLRGRIWFNSGEIPDNNNDDDLNGYTDDVRGWNFINYNNDPYDLEGHGTEVAGIVAGIARNCRIMPIKVLISENKEIKSVILSERESIIRGIKYAVDQGAQVINLSLISENYSNWVDVQEAIREAYRAGCVIIAGSGNANEPRVGFPAAYEEVLSVGATDIADERGKWAKQEVAVGPGAFIDLITNRSSGGSNYGRELDVVAPGVDIWSTIPSLVNEPRYSTDTGTSMAAPHVSGLAALILSKYPVKP